MITGITHKPTGYAEWDDGGEGTKIKCDTFRCGHCGNIIYVPRPSELRKMTGNGGNSVQLEIGGCRMCSALICAQCDNGTCAPFEAKLAKAEAADRFHRQLDGIYR